MEYTTFRSKLGSETLFIMHERCWWMLGQKPERHEKPYRYIYYLHSFLLNFCFAIPFPIHLIIGLLNSKSTSDIFYNMAFTFTALFASVKSYIIYYNFKRIKEMEELMCQLDECVKEPNDLHYFKHKVFPAIKHVSYLFYALCTGIWISMELVVVVSDLSGDLRHVYPAYFPFDAYGSTFKYIIGHMYQILGTSCHIMQNYINDTYGGMCMAYLAGHVRLLGLRISRIGYDKSKSLEQNNAELVQCIKEHKFILTFHKKVVDIVSYILFFQLLLAAFNMSVVIIYVMLYVNEFFQIISFTIYFIAMPMEVFPSCFYGSKLEMAFADLTGAIFRCNWTQQDATFKKNLRIFAEMTLRPVTIDAAGIVTVNLVAFLASLRMTYSLYMFVSEMK